MHNLHTNKASGKPELKINVFGGLAQQYGVNEIPREHQVDILNGYVDRTRMLMAREGSQLYIHTEDEKIISMRRLSLPGGYARMLAEFVKTSTNKVGFRLSGDPTAGYPAHWGQMAKADVSGSSYLDGTALWLDFDSYPCSFLTYSNKLFITNGADRVWLYDREVAFPLINVDASGNEEFDSHFMRGRHICLFRKRIWLANTPEASYNIVCNRFHNIDDGRDVYADQYGAWEDAVPSSFPEMIEIVGLMPLSERTLGVWSKGGIFALDVDVNGVVANVRKLSDISCVEGDYLIPELPMAFDVKRRAYLWTGQTFKEMEEIKDIIWDKDTNPFKLTEEIHFNTKNEWDRGSYLTGGGTYTASDWIPDVLTIAPDTANDLVGEKMDEGIDNTFSVEIKNRKLAQSFTCSAWDGGGNIPHSIKGVELHCLSFAGGTAPTLQVELVEYGSYPDKIGTGTLCDRKVLATWTKENADVGGEWKRFESAVPKIEATLKVGKEYFIEIQQTVGTKKMNWSGKNTTEKGYPYGISWVDAEPDLQDSFGFRVIYVPACQRGVANKAEYKSPIFQRNDVIGQILSWTEIIPKDGNDDDMGGVVVKFATKDVNTGLWDTENVTWWTVTNPYDLHHLPLKNYFQIKFELYNSTMNNTPLIYAFKIHYEIYGAVGVSGGQIIATENRGRVFLSLEGETLIRTPKGWYRYDENLGITRTINWGISGTGSTGLYTHCKEVYRGTVTGAGNETFTFRDTSRDFAVNELANWTAEMLIGTGKGQTREIVSNAESDGNGDVVCTVATWSPNPSTDSKFILTNTKQWRYMSTANTDKTSSDTATSGGASTLVHTGAGWKINEWDSIEITGGTGIGQIRTIASNTSDTITVNDAWDVEPQNGDTYTLSQDIRLTIETGLIDGEREGYSEFDKRFVGLRIFYESNYDEIIPFKLAWHTDRGSGSFTPDGDFNPGNTGSHYNLKLWTYKFPSDANRLGKFIIFDEISVPKRFVRGVKEIELFWTKLGKRDKKSSVE